MKVHCTHDSLVMISLLNRNPDNRNIHSPEQIARLAEILEYQGWRYPVKVSRQSDMVTSGHGRIEAAILNKWEYVPVNYQDYETPEQEYADTIADNAIASWSELNVAGIQMDVKGLNTDFNSDMLGGGSGSTLIACEKTNRRCFMMEVDPHYCDVIVARWEKYTGKKAILLTEGD